MRDDVPPTRDAVRAALSERESDPVRVTDTVSDERPDTEKDVVCVGFEDTELDVVKDVDDEPLDDGEKLDEPEKDDEPDVDGLMVGLPDTVGDADRPTVRDCVGDLVYVGDALLDSVARVDCEFEGEFVRETETEFVTDREPVGLRLRVGLPVKDGDADGDRAPVVVIDTLRVRVTVTETVPETVPVRDTVLVGETVCEDEPRPDRELVPEKVGETDELGEADELDDDE